MINRRLPDFFYNWISAVGALLSVVSFSIIVVLILTDIVLHGGNMYLGLITYCVLPVFLVLGLTLVAGGALWERRRLAQGKEPAIFPRVIRVDLTDPKQRNAALSVFVVAGIFLMATTVGTYKAYQVTESVPFCGTLCHTVMKPEFTAFQNSPHARTSCVNCHIGPGADWFVKSKMSGLYQIYSVIFKKYSRPIPTPVKNLRPARETCLQCHWPEKFFGARKNDYPHFLSDEKNTPYPISMLLNIGGGGSAHGPAEGIHWHMMISNKVEYIARDETRQDIGWVRVTHADGSVDEYNDASNPMAPELKAKSEIRTMDCIDCHNRPSHNYRSPLRTVNEAMAAGSISATLPFAKREAVKALDAEYDDTATALKEIKNKIEDFYSSNYPSVMSDRKADIDAMVAALGNIYTRNMFPEMKVTWRKYPDNIGHFQYAGCFRCHGGSLATSSGKTITNDCTVCHTLISQGPGPQSGISAKGLAFTHPVDVGGAEQAGNCSMCHTGGAELY